MQGFDTLGFLVWIADCHLLRLEERLRWGHQPLRPWSWKIFDKVWEWKDEYATTIKEQWGKMGLCRLLSWAFHPWRRFVSRARSLYLQERLDLPWWIYHQLGPSSSTSPFLISKLSTVTSKALFYHMNYMLEDGHAPLKLPILVLKLCWDVKQLWSIQKTHATRTWSVKCHPSNANKLIPIVGDEHADPV